METYWNQKPGMRKEKYRDYSLRGEEYELPGERILGERIREIGVIDIDRNVFKKTKHEKEILKLAKWQAKLDELRK